MDVKLLVFGLLVALSFCQGNPTGRSSHSVAETVSHSQSNAYNGGRSSYPVDTGPIGQSSFAGSDSQSSSSGFSGNGGAGGSFSGSQSQSGAESFVRNNHGELGCSVVGGEQRNYETHSPSFGEALGNAIAETASQVQSAVNSGINQLGSNVQNIANSVASGISSGLESLQATSAATAANVQNNVQNLANAVAGSVSNGLNTLNTIQGSPQTGVSGSAEHIIGEVQSIVNSGAAQLASNIHGNAQAVANTVANGISSGLETLNAAQANVQNNVQNLANAVAGSNLNTLNAVQGSSQTAASSSAESGAGQVFTNDRVGQNTFNNGNIDHTVSVNGGVFSSIGSGGASGSYQANTVTSVTQNGQTVINHEETVDRLGERPQTTSGTVVLDNHGQVISSEVRPSGSGNFAPRPETLPAVNTGYTQGSHQSSSVSAQNGQTVLGHQGNSGSFVPVSPNQGFAQGAFQSNSVSTSTQNGQTIITQERVTDRLGEQPHHSSETVVLDSNGNIVASSGPSNFAPNSAFSNGNAGLSADRNGPVVNGGENLNAQVSNNAAISEQPAVVPIPQTTGNSFFDSLSSAFGSGATAGNFHSSSVSSSTNQNGQTVVTHQETSDRFGEPAHSSSGTVVVNNGVVSGVTCVDNQCVTNGN